MTLPGNRAALSLPVFRPLLCVSPFRMICFLTFTLTLPARNQKLCLDSILVVLPRSLRAVERIGLFFV